MADYTSADPTDAFIAGMRRRGWTTEEAKGTAGNIAVESGFSPTVKSSVPNESSYGFLQWNKERLQGLKNYADSVERDWRDPETQMDWMDMERSGASRSFGGSDERTAYRRAFAGGGTPAEIAARFAKYVERPKDLSQSINQRVAAAGGDARSQNLRMFADARVGYPSPAPTDEGRTYGSTTGDIIWKKLDPKTFELSNRQPTPEATTPEQEQPDDSDQQLAAARMVALYGRRFTDTERAIFMHDLANHGGEVAIERAKRHLHMRQLADLNHDLKHDPNISIQDRVQELMDSGALRIDERGDLYTSVPINREASDRILEASKQWTPPEQQGVERDEGGYTQDQPDQSTGEWKSNIGQYINQAENMTPTTLGPEAQ
jgi:Phage tail lysozyme